MKSWSAVLFRLLQIIFRAHGRKTERHEMACSAPAGTRCAGRRVSQAVMRGGGRSGMSLSSRLGVENVGSPCSGGISSASRSAAVVTPAAIACNAPSPRSHALIALWSFSFSARSRAMNSCQPAVAAGPVAPL
eukprot:scaffold18385_cov42-Phaeocystis_antarctica.AAC.4